MLYLLTKNSESYLTAVTNNHKNNIYYILSKHTGFGSNINNMIAGCIYANKNNYNFILIDDIWCDGKWLHYFDINNNFIVNTKSFIDIEKDQNHIIANLVDSNYIKTKNMWDDVRHGYTYDEASIYAKKIYNPKNKSIFMSLYNKKYIGIHIRRGDKYIEATPIPINIYIEEIKYHSKLLNIDNIYYMTDDILSLSEIISSLPELNHYYIHKKTTGYDQDSHNNLDINIKNELIDNLITDINTLIKSDFAILTYSSNIGRFIALFRNTDECKSLDVKEWYAG